MIKVVAYYTVFVIDYYSVWVLFVHLKFIGFYYQAETCANFKPEQDWFVDLRILQVMDSPLNMWVNLFSVLKKYQKSWFIIGRPSGKRNERTQNEVWEKMKQIKNKAISMMRGKSPPSYVENKNTKFSWRPSWIFGGHLRLTMVFDKPVLYIYGNNYLYQFWYFYHKVNDRYIDCHILPFFHNADRK